MKFRNLVRIVYTGGPCAGKTTALSRTFDHFGQSGYRVLIVPEAATLLIGSGLRPQEFSELLFQHCILNLVLSLEKETAKLAESLTEQSVIMIYDRGTMDGKAYCSQKVWQQLLAENQVSEIQLRDERYDAVIHLVSAADGAAHFYTKTNTRQEEPKMAVEVDRKLQGAWSGHPYFQIIDNSTDFEGKMLRVLEAVRQVVDLSHEYPEDSMLSDPSSNRYGIPNPSIQKTD